VIIFPNGDYEYSVRQGAAPAVGEEIRIRGVLWSVASITRGSVATLYVERVDPPAATSIHAVPPIEANILGGREE
jgi:hypothetical protein